MLRSHLHIVPGNQHAKRSEEGRKQNQKETESIDTHEILNSKRLDPRKLFYKLRLGKLGIKEHEERNGENKIEQGNKQRNVAVRRSIGALLEEQEDGSREGKKNDDRQKRKAFHHFTIHTKYAMSPSVPRRIAAAYVRASPV